MVMRSNTPKMNTILSSLLTTPSIDTKPYVLIIRHTIFADNKILSTLEHIQISCYFLMKRRLRMQTLIHTGMPGSSGFFTSMLSTPAPIPDHLKNNESTSSGYGGLDAICLSMLDGRLEDCIALAFWMPKSLGPLDFWILLRLSVAYI